jgi:hypothetical protein
MRHRPWGWQRLAGRATAQLPEPSNRQRVWPNELPLAKPNAFAALTSNGSLEVAVDQPEPEEVFVLVRHRVGESLDSSLIGDRYGLALDDDVQTVPAVAAGSHQNMAVPGGEVPCLALGLPGRKVESIVEPDAGDGRGMWSSVGSNGRHPVGPGGSQFLAGPRP